MSAAVEKIEEKRKPEDFIGHRKRDRINFMHIQLQTQISSQVLPAQPILRTEKDIGSKNPETTAVSGFCYAIFKSKIKKISFPKNDLWGGLERNLLQTNCIFGIIQLENEAKEGLIK